MYMNIEIVYINESLKSGYEVVNVDILKYGYE